MSASNGDRSRFHRIRKQKFHNRVVRRALRATLLAAAAAGKDGVMNTPASAKKS